MEALGIVLGVLPLIVTALQSYDQVFVPFQRYKDYIPEFCRFQRRLLAQKTIFRSQCQLLLVLLINEDTARSMLEEEGHQEWRSSDLDAKLSKQLGSSAEACMATIKEIEVQLCSIEEAVEGINAKIANEGFPTMSASDVAWYTRIRKKLRFAFSESRLKDYIVQLHDSNQDFVALSDQTSKLLAANSGHHHHPPISSAITIKQCDAIQQASIHLYEALAISCSLHKAHQAHLQIRNPPHSQEFSAQLTPVDFRVGLSKVVAERHPVQEVPVWLLIKPALALKPLLNTDNGIHSHRSEQVSMLQQTLKREPKRECPRQRKRLKKQNGIPQLRIISATESQEITSVSSAVELDPAGTTGLQSNSARRPIQGEQRSMRDFCRAQDLCVQIRKLSSQAHFVQETYFGCLKSSSTTYELYYENQETISKRSINLGDLIADMGKRDRTKQPLPLMSLVESIKLARNIALFVLRFHATPLLTSSWGAHNITFFGLGKDWSQDETGLQFPLVGQLPEPFLKLKVQADSPSPGSPAATTDSQQALCGDGRIRNSDLFRLGVVLLELAYQAPLGRIRADPDRRGTQPPPPEFDLADKHSLNVGTLLGSRYAKVVRKCLNCDFGQDNELSTPELKEAVHKGVVSELEDLVRNFENNMRVF